MPKLQGYRCKGCDTPFEYTHMAEDDAATCSSCGSTDAELQLGGHTFSTIVPTYPGAKRLKAGYVHNYVNKPAEKISVSVPRAKGDT